MTHQRVPALSWREVAAWVPDRRAVRSATPEEVVAGLTADVYFVGTLEVLERRGLANQTVTAEVFANRAGLLAGTDEAVDLLRDRGLEVWSAAEGVDVSAHQVVLRIRGAYGRFGVMETAILGVLAASSGWATAARAIVEAAGGLPVISYGARHVHPAVASVMDRAALVGGFAGVSTILGARQAGLVPAGTMPHALMLMVGDTVEVARLFDETMPPEVPRTVLVDTFHDEVEEALRVARALPALKSVRLDTPRERGGVTAGLVRELRWHLDRAGFGHVGIFVSGGLSVERVRELAAAGAAGFGVGHYVASAPPLDFTMDLKEVDGRPVAKRGRIPGITEAPGLTRRL
jgi:nicotinate phosphoribosyltransferase